MLSKSHQEFQPSSLLSDTIKCFWYDNIDFGKQLSGLEVIPDGYAEIIFHFGSGCNVLQDGKLQSLPSPFMMGLLNQPIVFYAKGQLEIIAVRCYPWTVFDLLALQPGKEDLYLLKHPITQLQPVLENRINLGQIDQAITELEKYFLNATTGIVSNSTLFKAGVAMNEANGTRPVKKVAAAAHTTVRTLERKFRQSSGHTVKDVSALMRFEQVRNQLWVNPQINLAGLAIELGYADQSHLSREFKRFSGITPAAFARNATTGKQAGGNNFIGFVSA